MPVVQKAALDYPPEKPFLTLGGFALSAHFPRSVRLLQAQDFKFVFAAAKPYRNRAFTLLVRQNNLQHARLGLAISKKSARKAVQRNRLKRLVRESFRQWQKQLPNIDIVVLAKPEAVNMRNPEINKALEQNWASMKTNSVSK